MKYFPKILRELWMTFSCWKTSMCSGCFSGYVSPVFPMNFPMQAHDFPRVLLTWCCWHRSPKISWPWWVRRTSDCWKRSRVASKATKSQRISKNIISDINWQSFGNVTWLNNKRLSLWMNLPFRIETIIEFISSDCAMVMTPHWHSIWCVHKAIYGSV